MYQRTSTTDWYAATDQLSAELHHHDEGTGEHCVRVARLARLLGERLDLDSEAIRRLEMASLLHDIGKLHIPAETLLKPGALDEAEWVEMRQHPRHGFEMLQDTVELEPLAEIVHSHHERYDGSGYPRGLRSEEISLEARICAVVDAYEAMTSRRPYSEPLDHESAKQEVLRCAGTQFDPAVVDAFLEISHDEIIVALSGNREGALIA